MPVSLIGGNSNFYFLLFYFNLILFIIAEFADVSLSPTSPLDELEAKGFMIWLLFSKKVDLLLKRSLLVIVGEVA